MTVESVLRELLPAGYSQRIILQSISRLVSLGLVESSNLSFTLTSPKNLSPDTATIQDGDHILISIAGQFYLKQLAPSPVYMFFCAGDTSWYSDEHLKKFMYRYEDSIRVAQHRVDTLNPYIQESIGAWKDYLLSEVSKELRQLGQKDRFQWRTAALDRLCLARPSVGREGTSQVSRRADLDGDRTSQMSLPLEDQSTTQVQLAARSMPRLTPKSALMGKTQLARILWALELARRAALHEMSASELARLISAHGKIRVEEPNIARFFRQNQNREDYSVLWTYDATTSRYRISERGRVTFDELEKQLKI